MLAIAHQLLDFERAHNSLHALVLHLVHPADLAHVIAELFADVRAQLGLLHRD